MVTVLRGGYLYGVWPRTVLILIEFKFIVPDYDNLSCSVPVGFSRKDSHLKRIFSLLTVHARPAISVADDIQICRR